MAIVKMKRLRLFGMRSDREALLRRLQKLGCVEIDEAGMDLTDPEWAALTRPDSRGLSRARQSHTLLRTALDVLKEYAPPKGELFRKRPVLSEGALFDDEAYANGLQAAQEIMAAERQLSALHTERGKLEAQLAALAPWLSLDVPLELGGDGVLSVVFGTLPAKAEVREVEGAVAQVSDLAQLTLASQDQQLQYLLLVCHASVEEACTEAMRPFGFSRAVVRGWTGTAAENTRAVERRLAELAEETARTRAAIVAYAAQRDLLRQCQDRAAQDIAREEAKTRLVDTETAFYFQGWLPVPALEQLGGTLAGFTCAWETEDPKKEEYPQVPVQLKNNALTAPYSVVTEMYSLPAYDGLDPNPFIMPFFALFFGIMFADMGYGLLMVLGGLLGIKLLDPKGTMRNMLAMVAQCGVSTFLIGFLTGGFFGDAVSVLGSIFGQEWSLVPHLGDIRIGEIVISLPLNLLEGNNPLYVLVLAMILGAIHLFFGVCIGVYLNVRDGNWVDAVFDLSWWVIFAGAAVMVLAESPVVLIIGVAAMVITTFLKGKGIGRITGLFGAVYNGVTGYLGDILSYSRLMALMLAGSVIASVFNQLGSLGGIFLFIPVFLIGHVLNFGLNLIGCFVHTMRLQFLEFFGKWYREGGRPFQPLKYDTKFVDIKED